jgi:hypothetical protein
MNNSRHTDRKDEGLIGEGENDTSRDVEKQSIAEISCFYG